MTAPIIHLGLLAPILARLETLERTHAILLEITDRLRTDVAHLDTTLDTQVELLCALRAQVKGQD